jgi:hypothetical protein
MQLNLSNNIITLLKNTANFNDKYIYYEHDWLLFDITWVVFKLYSWREHLTNHTFCSASGICNLGRLWVFLWRTFDLLAPMYFLYYLDSPVFRSWAYQMTVIPKTCSWCKYNPIFKCIYSCICRPCHYIGRDIVFV